MSSATWALWEEQAQTHDFTWESMDAASQSQECGPGYSETHYRPKISFGFCAPGGAAVTWSKCSHCLCWCILLFDPELADCVWGIMELMYWLAQHELCDAAETVEEWWCWNMNLRYYLAAYALLKQLISIFKRVYNIPSLQLDSISISIFLESLLTTDMYMRALLNSIFFLFESSNQH